MMKCVLDILGWTGYLIKIILPHLFLRAAIRTLKVIYMAQIIFLLDSTALDLTPSLQKFRSQRIRLMTQEEAIK